MLSIKNLSYKIGDRVIFDNASATFLSGEKYAVTGINGAGKSTLFKIINSEIKDCTGVINYKGTISVLDQKIDEQKMGMSVSDFILQGYKALWDVIEKRDSLYLIEFTDKVGNMIAECEEKIIDMDGYSIDVKIEKFLKRIGTTPGIAGFKIKDISNADRMKVALIRALISDPDILLLDEPTNGIDIFAIDWLKGFLKDSFKGVLLFISHDVEFIDDIATKTADIDFENVLVYPGNYTNMIETKKSIKESSERESANRQKKIERVSTFISKFGAGTRAKQAKSKERMLKKLTDIDLKASNVVAPYIMFDKGNVSANNVVEIEGLTKADIEDGSTIINNLDMSILRGEKVGIIGKNGAGKSILIKMLAGIIDSDAGKINFGKDVKIGYFPQYHEDMISTDDKDTTVLNWVGRDASGVTSEQIRSMLGRMLFANDDCFKKMQDLSGGETVRCILAKIILQGANLILLDDPFSHLDIGSVLALKHAISSSKNKTFIIATNVDLSSMCDKLVIFEGSGNLFLHLGSFEDYKITRKKALSKS